MLRLLRNHLAKRGLGSGWMLSLDLSKLSLWPTPFPLPESWLSQETLLPEDLPPDFHLALILLFPLLSLCSVFATVPDRAKFGLGGL